MRRFRVGVHELGVVPMIPVLDRHLLVVLAPFIAVHFAAVFRIGIHATFWVFTADPAEACPLRVVRRPHRWD